MNYLDYEDFFTRAKDVKGFNKDLYLEKISSFSATDKDKTLFNEAFSNHVNTFDPSIDKLAYSEDASDRHIKSDHLSAYFINKIYQIPKISDWDSCEKDSCEKVSFDKFISEFLITSFSNQNKEDSFNLGSNRLRFVVGDVGEGKSAFIQKINYEVDKKNKEWDENYQLLTIRVDLEKKYNCEKLTKPKSIKDSFAKFLFETINRQIESRVPRISSTKLSEFGATTEYIIAIKRLTRFLKSEKVRLVLLIDNLDFYHYYYARYAFFNDHHKEQQKSISENIDWLINFFQSRQHLGDQGFNVMIAVRSHVYKLLSNTSSTETSPDTTLAVKITTPSNDVVLKTRFKLLEKAIEVVIDENPDRGDALRMLFSKMKLSMLGNKGKFEGTVFDTISSLGQHGNRNLVRFLSSLNISYKDYELMERFFKRTVATLQIMYFNGMNKKFAQSNGHFPNLFLNDCVIKEPHEGFEDAHKPHVHTYWLKYFILKYITHHESVKISKILKIFCVKGEYEEHLVKHILGSLCTADESGCLELEDGNNDEKFTSKRIFPTSRTVELLKSHAGVDACFNSMYLQVVIDDKWLCYPKDVASNIFLPDSEYSYLYIVDDLYRKEATNITLSKSYAMLHFVKVLKESFQVEIKENKPLLYEVLSEIGAIPNFETMTSNILDSARGVFNALYKSRIGKINDLTEFSTKLNSKEKHIEFFRNYYTSKVLVEE